MDPEPSAAAATTCLSCGQVVVLAPTGTLSRPAFKCPRCSASYQPVHPERSRFIFPWRCPRCDRHAGYRVLGAQLDGQHMAVLYACRSCGVALGKRKRLLRAEANG